MIGEMAGLDTIKDPIYMDGLDPRNGWRNGWFGCDQWLVWIE